MTYQQVGSRTKYHQISVRCSHPHLLPKSEHLRMYLEGGERKGRGKKARRENEEGRGGEERYRLGVAVMHVNPLTPQSREDSLTENLIERDVVCVPESEHKRKKKRERRRERVCQN